MNASEYYKGISDPFKVTKEEYEELDEKFGDLCNFAAWQLLKKNTKNNHLNDIEDAIQEQKMHLLIAGAYYKRQVYIESCLQIGKRYAKDKLMRQLMRELADLWENRKRHGANRQKFGLFQEKILDLLMKKLVPSKDRPSKTSQLVIDSKFATYCKAILWNSHKTMGKRITKEKAIRSGLVSLSEFDYLVGCS
jgi:hypothetical protein